MTTFLFVDFRKFGPEYFPTLKGKKMNFLDQLLKKVLVEDPKSTSCEIPIEGRQLCLIAQIAPEF